MTFVITNVNDIAPEWLGGILQKSGVLGSGKVLQIRALLTKTLQVSTVTRLAIDYSDDAPSTAPATLFLKLSKPDASVDIRSEVDFYVTVGSRTSGPLVQCHDAAFSEETNRSHLLLEDLFHSHTQPIDGQLPSVMQCESAISTLAEFHAKWWQHPDLGNGIGRFFDLAWVETFLSDLNRSVHAFLTFLGDNIAPERRRIYERLLASSRNIWGRLADPTGLTVTHGDVHWWNFLYPRDPSINRTRMIDWQLWHLDLGARDLAFLIAFGGFAKEKNEDEMGLLHLYHKSLRENGVRDYPRPAFWNDYRLSAIRNLNLPVIFWSQGKHETTWKNAIHRAFQSFDELGCIELLDA